MVIHIMKVDDPLIFIKEILWKTDEPSMKTDEGVTLLVYYATTFHFGQQCALKSKE